MKHLINLIYFTIFLHCSSAVNAQWTLSNGGNNSGVTHCFIETSSGVLLSGGDAGSIFSSADNGNTWTTSNTGIRVGTEIECLGKNSAGVFAAWDTIYFSTDNGNTWTTVNKNSKEIFAFAFLSDTIFASSYLGGVIMSPDNGTTWTSVSTGLPPTSPLRSIVSKGNLLFAAPDGNGIFISSNSGASWTPVNTGLPDIAYASLSTNGSSLYAGTDSGLYISTNNGALWSLLSSENIRGITFVGNAMLATTGRDVLRSADGGVSWENFTNNIDTICPYGIAGFYATSQYVFCGVESGCSESIYRISKNEVLSVNEIEKDNIKCVVSPNPFNNSITVDVNQLIQGKVIVQNMLGEEIFQSKLTELKSVFNLGNLPSGMYILTILTEQNINTQKIIQR